VVGVSGIAGANAHQHGVHAVDNSKGSLDQTFCPVEVQGHKHRGAGFEDELGRRGVRVVECTSSVRGGMSRLKGLVTVSDGNHLIPRSVCVDDTLHAVQKCEVIFLRTHVGGASDGALQMGIHNLWVNPLTELFQPGVCGAEGGEDGYR
jgi:hypothetical protein